MNSHYCHKAFISVRGRSFKLGEEIDYAQYCLLHYMEQRNFTELEKKKQDSRNSDDSYTYKSNSDNNDLFSNFGSNSSYDSDSSSSSNSDFGGFGGGDFGGRVS